MLNIIKEILRFNDKSRYLFGKLELKGKMTGKNVETHARYSNKQAGSFGLKL